jgi:hypothetical protein
LSVGGCSISSWVDKKKFAPEERVRNYKELLINLDFYNQGEFLIVLGHMGGHDFKKCNVQFLKKVKVKLSLCLKLIKQYAMKMYGGVDV